MFTDEETKYLKDLKTEIEKIEERLSKMESNLRDVRFRMYLK